MYYTFSFNAGYKLEATIDLQWPLKWLKIFVFKGFKLLLLFDYFNVNKCINNGIMCYTYFKTNYELNAVSGTSDLKNQVFKGFQIV